MPLQPFLYTFRLEMARFGAIWVDLVVEVAAKTEACGLMQFTSRRSEGIDLCLNNYRWRRLKVKRSKVKEIIVLIKARSFLDELNLEHLTS